MNRNDWDPELYLKFNRERIQPSIDLVARIESTDPECILDIGCGPGNSTQILVGRWPDAEVTGADNSPAMIQKAAADYPKQRWILYDATKDGFDETFDIVFSNAAIQWIPDHSVLIERFSKLLNRGGKLAIQVPLFYEMPIAKALENLAGRPEWKTDLTEVRTLFTMHPATYYYDLLSSRFETIDMWTTDYYHRMSGYEAIIEMMRSTGLKPYLDRLPGETDRSRFEQFLIELLKKEYPEQLDSCVLFPFRRLFFVAGKK